MNYVTIKLLQFHAQKLYHIISNIKHYNESDAIYTPTKYLNLHPFNYKKHFTEILYSRWKNVSFSKRDSKLRGRILLIKIF